MAAQEQAENGKTAANRPGRFGVFLESIKFSHSIFALPFALSAFFMASAGSIDWPLLGKIIAACVFARTAAMSFNRLIDARIDAVNPRTSARAIPAGQLSPAFMAAATLASCCLFGLCCAWINSLALALCPVALVVLLGYSYTKRFTSLWISSILSAWYAWYWLSNVPNISACK